MLIVSFDTGVDYDVTFKEHITHSWYELGGGVRDKKLPLHSSPHGDQPESLGSSKSGDMVQLFFLMKNYEYLLKKFILFPCNYEVWNMDIINALTVDS